ncbi:chromosome partitioning protein ParB [Babesia caballi]|uniref:Chromosome partitioning protein ParB n=1 Tax=Babesia caballi TaxID=5871 RepID=A0AAV4LPH8_BABCB|nr:chromosome partitioning protein ParB [Babesia caballi]
MPRRPNKLTSLAPPVVPAGIPSPPDAYSSGAPTQAAPWSRDIKKPQPEGLEQRGCAMCTVYVGGMTNPFTKASTRYGPTVADLS